MNKYQYSIKVYKQYFNFAASHFLIFEDGSREPLHGHNYRVMVKGKAGELKADMVFDFLDIKPIVREACDFLDHKLLLPEKQEKLRWEDQGENFLILPPDNSQMSLPKSDILFLPIHNTSAECLAIYLNERIRELTWERFKFVFKSLEVEVEETPGQSAIYHYEEDQV